MRNTRINNRIMRGSAIVAAVVLLALLLPAVTAKAQGMFGILPGPITSDDLDRYADRLDLSDEQLLAISEIHAHYLVDFRRFRESEADAFLDQMRQNMPRRFDPDAMSMVKQTVEQVGQLMRQISRIDDEFFLRMQSVLTQDQVEIMPRIRLHRERARLATDMSRGMAFINPSVLVDLSEIIESIHPAPHVRAEIDPLVADYERRLTRSARELFQLGMRKVVEVTEELEGLGLTEDTFRNPREMAGVMQAAQGIWQEHVTEFLDAAANVSGMQRRSFQQFAEMLPDADARSLRRAFFRRAYTEASMIGHRAEREFDAALSLDALSPDLHRTIEAMAAQHRQQQDRRADQIADLLDQIRHQMTLDQMIQRDRDARRQRITEIREQAGDADSQAIESLHAMLGPDRVSQLAQAGDNDEGARQVEAFIAMGRGGQVRRVEGRRVRAGGEGAIGARSAFSSRSLPSRIARRDINQYARTLGLADDEKALLESLHEDYIDAFESIHLDMIEPLDEQARAMWRDEGADAANRVEQLASTYRDAFDAIRELDESFFRDLRLIVIGDGQDQADAALERLRRMRERDAYAAAFTAAAPGGPGTVRFMRHRTNESDVDLVRLVRSLPLHPADREQLHASFEDYEQQLSELLARRFDAELEFNKASASMMLTMRQSRGEDRRGGWRDMGRLMRTVGQTLNDERDAIAALNRATLDSLMHELVSDHAVSLRGFYYREAFPFVYEDSASAEPFLDAALSLNGLGDAQRSRLRDIAVQYRAHYAELSQQMVQVYVEDTARGDDEARRRGLNATNRNRLDRLQFERDELNRRTDRQIRAVLTPGQLDQIEFGEEDRT